MSAGLREGILGLRWKNVDLQEGVIRVREQIGEDEDGNIGLGPVKTDAGIRDIPLPAGVIHLLNVEFMTNGQDLEGFVCRNSDGRFIQPMHFNRVWRKVREDLGLPEDMHPHDLRGSWITWMAESGKERPRVN